MSENKQALQVAATEKWHCYRSYTFRETFTVVSLLGLEHMTTNITIGFNLDSKN